MLTFETSFFPLEQASSRRHILSVILCSALLSFAFIDKVNAVTIFAGSGVNETDPGTFAWNNVGTLNLASIVYLGDINSNGTFWVLTAYHVSGGLPATVQLNGTGDSNLETYNTVSGSFIRLNNTGVSVPGYGSLPTDTDMAMFRISLSGDTSLLSNLSIASALPDPGATLYMAGYGGGTKRWGTNNADITVFGDLTRDHPTDDGAGTNVAFLTDYDTTMGTPSTEGQVISGDSGGAVFALNAGVYELAGLMFAAGTDGGGKSYTYSSDLSLYRDQIIANAVPEPETWALLFLGGLALTLGMRRSARMPVTSERSEKPRIPSDPSPFL